MISTIKLILSKRHKIFFKIISLTLIVSILPIFILAFLLNRVSDRLMRENVFNEMQNISYRAVKEISLFISGTENILRLTAETVGNANSDERKLKLTLQNVVLNLDGFESISFIGENGQEVVSSDIETDKVNYKEEAFFKKAIKGDTYYSDVYIPDTLIPTIKIAVPVKTRDKVIGVLLAKITVTYLWDLIDNIKIGKTGHVYVVDKNGIVIAHIHRERILRHESFQSIPIVKNLMAGNNSTAEYINENGLNTLGSGSVVPNLGWGIVAEQPIEEAFKLIRKINQLTIILVIFTICMAVIISFLKSTKIVSPIKELTDGVRTVAKGDLSYLITVKSEDEIGELAENFNKMTSSLKSAQEQLLENEKMAILGRLSAKIAHEVRNPLQAIKGSATFFRKRFPEDDMAQDFANTIIQETDQLNRFVSDVLFFSKKIEVRFILTNMNAILENICQLVLKDKRFEEIKIQNDLDKGIQDSLLDPEHLQRAFLNVIINSAQAMPYGGEIKLRTKQITRNSKDYIEVVIQDNGTGIPTEIRENIFKPFFTTKKTGTGLGLFYFYETIKQHEGEIKLESELERGTTLFVYLPLKGLDN